MRPKVRIITYRSFAGICLAVAGTVYFVNHSLALISIVLLLGFLILEASAFRLDLINHQHGKAGKFFFRLIIAIAVPFCVWLARIEIKNPIPDPEPVINKAAHFKFILNTAEFPDSNLELTNAFLERKNVDPPPTPHGRVCIPVQNGQSNVTFRVSVFNVTNVIPEFGAVKITLSRKWNCRASPGWQEAVAEYKGNGPAWGQSWVWTLRSGILPGNGEELGSITVTGTNNFIAGEDGAMSVMARAKDSPTSGVFFVVDFIRPIDRLELVRPITVEIQQPPNEGLINIPTNEFRNIK